MMVSCVHVGHPSVVGRQVSNQAKLSISRSSLTLITAYSGKICGELEFATQFLLIRVD